ncbi:exonuclease SbcCD subunit D [Candidatus Woesearchaeota archaeon]|nr:exonuclease SbcCD subunit D [Candidatus Woesearchaeota archaeon]
MKYAHLADLHLGSWREDKMRQLSTQAFLQAIDDCIQRDVDFILFSGDIFNTSLPSLDTLKIVTKKLKELNNENIPLYVVAGSHDFSPSGKTMIDVLENAGLLKNVCKGTVDPETQQLHLNFTLDQRTGAKITGLLGRKGLLDRTYYQNLALESLEQESGYKIFMFHTTLTELKPKHLEMMEAHPVSFLPKHFNYYAGGHIHHKTLVELPEYGPLTYPGALFPNNFAEVEKYSHGGYYLITVEEKPTIEWIPVITAQHLHLGYDCSHKSPEVATFEITNHFLNQDLTNTIITLRIHGTLEHGRIADINFKEIFNRLYEQGAYFVMKNTAAVQSLEFEEIKIATSSPEMMEEEIIKEHLQQSTLFDKETERHLIHSLLAALNTIKTEGETVKDFQDRVTSETRKLLAQ